MPSSVVVYAEAPVCAMRCSLQSAEERPTAADAPNSQQPQLTNEVSPHTTAMNAGEMARSGHGVAHVRLLLVER
jgi:hypothetical protein